MKIFIKFLLASFLCLVLTNPAIAEDDKKAPIIVGSKLFTESVIISEIMKQMIEQAGVETIHQRELGGTQILWKALLRGDIDVYSDYTGTIEKEIFDGTPLEEIPEKMKVLGVKMLPSLGFNDTYALGMKKAHAQKLGISKISDLKKHPELTLGFSNEFMDRSDGWPGLKAFYHLPQTKIQGLSHDLAYRGLENGAIDLTDLYSTDAEIAYYDLIVLEDDLHYFPGYEGVILYREELENRSPQAVEQLKKLSGTIPEDTMIGMNHAVKLKKQPEATVASGFIEQTFQIKTKPQLYSVAESIWERTKEHLFLVSISLGAAILFSIPLGILAAFYKPIAGPIMSIVGIIQTIPSLAILVFMIPLLGIGAAPAIVALFLYSLLPIVRNTYTGLIGIPDRLKESAAALGLPARQSLWKIELPMAAPTILAGIKTSAVINVGTATLGALIGAGGYGQPILTGIRLDDMGLILQGAIPAAVLALLVQGFFSLCEYWVVPKGLRLKG